jgi:hypothetical protein
MAQEVSRRFVNVEAPVRCEVSLCAVCGGQTGRGSSYSQSTSVCLLASSCQSLYSYFFHLPPIWYSLGSSQHSYTKHNSFSLSPWTRAVLQAVGIFSSSVALLIMPVAPQKRRPLNVDVSQENRYKSTGNTLGAGGGYGGCFGVVTLFYAKKSLSKTDRCAGALSWRRNQLLTLHFSCRFFLTAFVKRRRIQMYISLFTVAIPVNYTTEFQ